MSSLGLWLPALLVAFLLALARYLQLALRQGRDPQVQKRSRPCRTLVVLGSGGHTAEMLRLLSGITDTTNYAPRVYVVARGDQMSVKKVKEFEASMGSKEEDIEIKTIPRARQVRQSYLSSVLTTTLALLKSLPLVASVWPDVVLCNGPGTCIPLCLSAYLLRYLGLKQVKLVYIESICRVNSLSLSARILYSTCTADHLLVQWPQLAKTYPRTHYLGKLI